MGIISNSAHGCGTMRAWRDGEQRRPYLALLPGVCGFSFSPLPLKKEWQAGGDCSESRMLNRWGMP